MNRSAGLRATLGALAAALATIYWPVLRGQAVFFDRDIILYWRPYIEWAVKTVSEGHLPLWVPGAAFGMPFLADPSFQFFYPPTWFNLILRPVYFYPLYVIGHALLGGWGAYRLLALLTRRSEAGFLAAVLFTLSGPWVSAANLWHHYAGVAYLPWVLLGIERVRLRVGGAWRGLGLAAGAQALAGSADLCLASAVLSLVRAAATPRHRAKVVLPDLARAVALAACLASIQWLPTAILLSESQRAQHDTSTILYWSAPPASLPDMFVPGLMLEQTQADEWRAKYLDDRTPFLASFYLGATALPLAVLGARAWPAGGLAFLALIFGALGRNTPVGLILSHVPPFAWLRYPMKVFWPAALVFAALAAVGLATARARKTSGGGRLRLILITALVLLVVLFIQRPDGATTVALMVGRLLVLGGATAALVRWGGRSATALLLLMVTADVTLSAKWDNNLAPAQVEQYKPPHADKVREIAGHERIQVSLTVKQADEATTLPATRLPIAAQLLLLDRMVPPQLLRWGLLGSIDPDFTGLVTSRYARVLERIKNSPFLLPNVLWISGVKYGLRLGSYEPTPQATTIQNFETVAVGKVRLVEMPWPSGRVRRVSSLISSKSPEDALDAVLTRGFNPEVSAVTPDSPSSSFPAGGTARIVSDVPDRVTVATEGPSSAWIVLNDEWRRGWSVSVDGKPEKLLRMNYLFRGVAVPPGAHTIVFNYSPPGLIAGFLLAIVGLAVLMKSRFE